MLAICWRRILLRIIVRRYSDFISYLAHIFPIFFQPLMSDALKKRKSKVLRGEGATAEMKRGRVEGDQQVSRNSCSWCWIKFYFSVPNRWSYYTLLSNQILQSYAFMVQNLWQVSVFEFVKYGYQTKQIIPITKKKWRLAYCLKTWEYF